MPAKKGFQRFTIDVTKDTHIKLKMLAAILDRSMHSMIVEKIESIVKDFKGIGSIEKVKAQNSK
ncbi:hypothetical protein KAH94_03270 [bacterium]|nr:hypothetical protein [bacterium]